MSDWDGIDYQPLTEGDLRRWQEVNRTDLGDPDKIEDALNDQCQPIGCDAGYHVPGCKYEAVDRGDVE